MKALHEIRKDIVAVCQAIDRREYVGGRDGNISARLPNGNILVTAAGIRKGDIVFRIGDRKIFAVEDVRKALRSIQAGDTVVVQVNRRGKVLGLGAKKPASPQSEKIQPEKTPPTKTQPKKLKQRDKVR